MRTWTVDTVPPDTVITSGPPATVDNGSATFAFAATEAGARFECALDGAVFGGCAVPLVLNDLPDGPHTLRVRAWDVVGNVDPTPATHSWTVARPMPPPPPAPDLPPAAVDRTPPAEVAGVRVVAGDTSVAITWRLPGDADLDHVTVTRVTPGKTVRTAVVYNAAGAGLTDRGLTNGLRYRYRITTRDRAGNASAGVEVAATPQAALYAPARGAAVTAPPLLRWKAVPNALYYNVQLWRVSAATQAAANKPVKVLSAWPAKTSYKLGARWTFEGKTQRLLPGRYRWYVWPGLGKRTAKKYGKPIGESTFTVKGKRATAK